MDADKNQTVPSHPAPKMAQCGILTLNLRGDKHIGRPYNKSNDNNSAHLARVCVWHAAKCLTHMITCKPPSLKVPHFSGK